MVGEAENYAGFCRYIGLTLNEQEILGDVSSGNEVRGTLDREIGKMGRVWGVLFGAAVVSRNALDWFAPPLNFQTRAAVSTYLGIGLLVASGFCAAWRSRSVVAGTVAGVTTAAIGGFISIVGAVGLLAIWHGPQTMMAVRGSGGLGEVFTLPLLMILPGLLVGTVGGIAGAASHRLHSA